MHTIETAVRMVGHLLEHNGTRGESTPFVANKDGHTVAYDDPSACQWCLCGAYRAVVDVLMPYYDRQLRETIERLLESAGLLHELSLVRSWDGQTDQRRSEICKLLQSYTVG